MFAFCWIRTLDYHHELALRLNSLYVVITTVIRMAFNPLKPSGYYMYHRFNIHKFDSYVLPTQCIYVFCVNLGKYSDYFPVRH
jgi:hypothetical protein